MNINKDMIGIEECGGPVQRLAIDHTETRGVLADQEEAGAEGPGFQHHAG